MKINFKSNINKSNFKNWYRLIKGKAVKIKYIKKIGEINRDNNEFGTSLIDTNLIFKNKVYKRAVHLEGDSVVVIPIIKSDKKLKTIMIRQFRVPIGSMNIELVSGSVENKKFKLSAIKEVKEELNINLRSTDLIELNKKPINLLPGNHFARVKFYAFKCKFKSSEINRFNFLRTGNSKRGEYLATVVKNFQDLKKIQNASVIISLKLLKDKKILKYV